MEKHIIKKPKMQTIASFLSGGSTVERPSAFLLVHVNIFLYALSFWIQQPVLPYLSKELGADAVTFGKLSSAMSVLALMGGGALGRLTDRKGAKISLITSHLGSLFMYTLMGWSQNLTWLFASRFGALLQHAMLCAQAALTDLVPEDKRSVAMGRLSLSYAVGMVLGSPLGGLLATEIGYLGAARVAAALTLVCVIADVVFLPNFSPKQKQQQTEEPKEKPSLFSEVFAFVRIIKQPPVYSLLGFLFPISLGIGCLRSMFPLAGKEVFGIESSDLGFYISYCAFIGLLTNVVCIGPIVKRLGEVQAVIFAAVLNVLCSSMYIAAGTYTQLLVVSIPSTVSSTILYTLSGSLMSLAVDASEAGTAISLSHATRSLVGIVSPLVGGYLFEAFEFSGLCVACMLGGTLSAIIGHFFLSVNLNTKSKKE